MAHTCDNCTHAKLIPGDWSEFWGAMVQHPSSLECEYDLPEPQAGEECPQYEAGDPYNDDYYAEVDYRYDTWKDKNG